MQRVRRQIGAEGIGAGEEWRNRSVTVAVLDTGIGHHVDLNGRLVDFRDFVNGRGGQGTGSARRAGTGAGRVRCYDDSGHGTHVCGIICGSGEASGGLYRGIAPGARLVVGKVLDKNGEGLTRAMLEGLQWVLDMRDAYGVRVLNISVGIGDLKEPEKTRALRRKVEEVWSEGIVVVCAAGNKGPGDDTISSVGGSERVITVGCHDEGFCPDPEKSCQSYSGRGRRNAPVRKPDLVAPGTQIVSCSVRCRERGGMWTDAYVAKSGTSMATPIVAGCAALLLQKEPWLTNEQVKERLLFSARDLGEPWNQQGWGMVDARRLLGG